MESTLVSFASGALRGRGAVVALSARAGGAIVVTSATPFHPVDHTWPDQPGDRGTLSVDGQSVPVVEAVMAAVSDDGTLAVGAEIPVKRGVAGWTWLVGHLLPVPETPAWLTVGTDAVLDVDADHRAALSRAHTACHLASLALDLAVADLWRKDPGEDALGTPDFEGRANQSSSIHADGSVDQYRLGKSLRRAGFEAAEFAASLAEREDRINAQLSRWVASHAPSRVEVDGPTIVDRRRWRCELPEGEAVILCGGTHAASLDEFAEITVNLTMSDPQSLTMSTKVAPAL